MDPYCAPGKGRQAVDAATEPPEAGSAVLFRVRLRAMVADEGTVIVFIGVLEPAGWLEVVVAVDRRLARPIAAALSAGTQPVVEAEHWQIAWPWS